MTDPIHNLINLFRLFPGVGPRQARRFVYYLLNAPPEAIGELKNLLDNLKRQVNQCLVCYRYFPQSHEQDKKVCSWCREHQEATTLMLVEKDVDMDNLERSGAFAGQFFVLGGLVPILEETPSKVIRLNELKQKIKKTLSDGPKVEEIIIALSASSEGDYTTEFLQAELQKIIPTKAGVKVTTLGRGLATGTEVEYSDAETLRQAFKNRQFLPS